MTERMRLTASDLVEMLGARERERRQAMSARVRNPGIIRACEKCLAKLGRPASTAELLAMLLPDYPEMTDHRLNAILGAAVIQGSVFVRVMQKVYGLKG